MKYLKVLAWIVAVPIIFMALTTVAYVLEPIGPYVLIGMVVAVILAGISVGVDS